MGMLRLFLAYVVVLFHSPEGVLPRPIHPALAVQCFYVISGFYMQLIIKSYHDANDNKWALTFYKSRFVRIFSIYYVFLLLTFALNFKFDFPTLSLFVKNHDFVEALIVIANNVLIFGQSVLRLFFYDLDAGKFVFVDTYKNLIPITNKASFTMMMMSWTLDVELMFYLVAPFILMRSSSGTSFYNFF